MATGRKFCLLGSSWEVGAGDWALRASLSAFTAPRGHSTSILCKACAAWQGRFTQTARLYTGGSNLASAAAFSRALALDRDASPSVVGRVAHKRASAKDVARTATKAGDLRLRANKPAPTVNSETQKKYEFYWELWAEKINARAAETLIAHESRMKKQSHLSALVICLWSCTIRRGGSRDAPMPQV